MNGRGDRSMIDSRDEEREEATAAPRRRCRDEHPAGPMFVPTLPLVQEHAVQRIIALAQALQPWTPKFRSELAAVLEGVAQQQAADAGMTTLGLLCQATERVLAVEAPAVGGVQ